MSNFAKDVKKDIETCLQGSRFTMPVNELELQMQFALHWKTSCTGLISDVLLEYCVPASSLGNIGTNPTDYVWAKAGSDKAYFDVVLVSADGSEFLPVEFKFKTKKLELQEPRFGIDIGAFEILKEQSAQDLGRYDFWRDVRRLELARTKFPSISGGLAVFVTNDNSYWNNPANGKNPQYRDFSMKPGKHGHSMSWRDPSGEQIPGGCFGRPNFILDGEYQIEWENACFKQSNTAKFSFCIVQV